MGALIVVLVVALAAGCSSKTKQVPGAGTGGSQLGDTGIGGNTSSLKDLQNGTMGGTGGPLSDIHFGYNTYTIEPQDGSVLKANASWLEGHPQTRVQVEGHCDERGSEEYNIALGAKRAQSAKDYLVTLGIPSSRISTISYGKELPLCTEHDESCWSQNRRDHFVVQQ
ncbi:MAG TPA: peptidoglycan-associated lipoprotein Pal [Candidatus Binataceae bacterium]|nr:peptidoglycan-associated lipoprotein Pal [Candidatus Binataceae bacterium]